MIDASNRQYLIRTMLGEAANQSDEGMAGVAHVILNRAKDDRWGNDVRSVVLAKNQFEPWNDPAAKKRMLGYRTDSPEYQRAARIADGVLSGDIADMTGGADHFLNADIVRQRRGGSLPSWAEKMWDTRHVIGDHTFLGGSGVDTLAGGDGWVEVTDPALLEQLNAPDENWVEVTDPAILAQLNGEEAPVAAPAYDGPIDGGMRAVQDGFFLGFGDNVGAAMGALAGADPQSGEFLDYSRSFGERYDENLALERAKRAEFDEQNPYLSPALKATGALGGAITGSAAAGIKGATTGVGQIGQAIGLGGGIGAVTGAGEADGPGESRLVGAGIGAAGGAAGGLIGIPLSAVVSRVGKAFGKGAARIFAKPKAFDRETGQLTEEGARQLQEMGLDPVRVSDQLAQAFAEEAGEAVGPRAAANSFGIPLTRGQATGDVPQIASEEAMRAGARGQGAYDVMKGFDDRQGAAVQAAREGVVPNPSAITAVDAADMAIPGIQGAAQASKAAAQQAYDIFEEAGGGVRGDAVKTLARNIVQSLKAEALDIDPTLTNANQSLNRMTQMLDGADRGAVPFMALERTRQMLRRNATAAQKGANGADQEAMRLIMQTYDDWLEGAVDYALTDGTAATLDQVKQARGLWADYLKTFTGRKGADNYIRKIVEDEATPDQVAGWLFGASKNIGGGQSARLAKKMRDVLGAGSQEFQALKQAAWDRLTMKADTPRGIADMESALREFTAGKGKTLAAELFDPKELERIKEFRVALKALIPPKKAGNPSGSGYEGARATMALMRGASTALGFASGGAGGALAGSMAPQAIGNFTNNLAARAAAKGITGPAPTISGGLVGGATGGAGLSGAVNQPTP